MGRGLCRSGKELGWKSLEWMNSVSWLERVVVGGVLLVAVLHSSSLLMLWWKVGLWYCCLMLEKEES